MNKYIRLGTALAAAAVLVGACGAAAATPDPTAEPVPAAATPVPIATADSTPLVATPRPALSPSMPADPKAPAYVTIAGTHSLLKDVTRTKDGDCERVSGGVVQGTGNASDARLSGTGTFELGGLDCGGLGWETGTLRIENAGGAWEGFCSGAIWDNENASDMSCWLTGSGAWEGLTSYYHSTSAGVGSSDMAVILPMPAPKQP